MMRNYFQGYYFAQIIIFYDLENIYDDIVYILINNTNKNNNRDILFNYLH